MAATLFRSSTRAALRAGASATRPAAAGIAGMTFTRGKATLPDLPCMLCCPESLLVPLPIVSDQTNPLRSA